MLSELGLVLSTHRLTEGCSGQGVGVVLAEVAAAAGQDVFVELHLGPAVITSHPRIVAPAARACQAPAIDELFGV